MRRNLKLFIVNFEKRHCKRLISVSVFVNNFQQEVNDVVKHVHDQPKTNGLVPIFINANTGKFRQSATITLGARGDSYYEYLFKMWLQSGKTDQLWVYYYIFEVTNKSYNVLIVTLKMF